MNKKLPSLFVAPVLLVLAAACGQATAPKGAVYGETTIVVPPSPAEVKASAYDDGGYTSPSVIQFGGEWKPPTVRRHRKAADPIPVSLGTGMIRKEAIASK